jgi:hypothetical protein
MGSKYGQTELDIRDPGLTIKLQEKVPFGMLMVICTTANSATIKVMGLAFTLVKMELFLKASGKMMFSMAKVQPFGQTAPSTLEITLTAKKKVMESMNGPKETNILENGSTIRLTVPAYMSGKTAGNMMDSGSKT